MSFEAGRYRKSMPPWQRKILADHQALLVQDLSVRDIINIMKQDGVLTDDQWDRINSKPTRTEQVEEFLELLPRRGERAMVSFLNALESNCEHLYDALKAAFDNESPDNSARAQSDIYEEVPADSGAYHYALEAGAKGSNEDPYLKPAVFTNPGLQRQGDPACQSREKHKTVEINADVTADVVEDASADGAGSMYSNTANYYLRPVQNGAEGLYHRRAGIGNFTFTGEKISLKKGDTAFLHTSFAEESQAIIMSSDLLLLCLHLSFIKAYGQPEREKWYSRLALTPHQAEHTLKSKNTTGCFLVYPPTTENHVAPYTLSLSIPDGTILHYPIYKFQNDQLGFKGEEFTFNSLKDLVEYHKMNRSSLECRLKRAPAEANMSVTLGEDCDIDASEVELESELMGKGYSSELYQGRYKGLCVAVVKHTGDLKSVDDILEGAKILRSVKHKNIPTLYGVINQEPPSLVLECLLEGDLCQWLKTNIGNIGRHIYLQIVQQISKAVQYLHGKNWILHRDIAAHNCQVGQSKDSVIVKLGEFSRARRVKHADVYKAEKSEKKPIRWSAPEALKDGKYSTKSDVWSLGILIAEVFTNGRKPFNNMKNDAVSRLLMETGQLALDQLVSPEELPRDIYDLLSKCFCQEPAYRPSASAVCESIHGLGHDHHLQPVDPQSVMRHAFSTTDLVFDDDGLASNKSGILSRLRRKNKKR